MSDGTGSASDAANDTAYNYLTDPNYGVDAVFQQGPTYVGPGDTTQAAWDQATQVAANPSYESGANVGIDNTALMIGNWGLTNDQLANLSDTNSLTDTYAQLATDATNTEANGYDAVRQGVVDTTMETVNQAYNNSGLFGSDSNVGAAQEELAYALGQLDLEQYNQAIQNQKDYLAGQATTEQQAFDQSQTGVTNQSQLATDLQNYYNAALLPSATLSGVGAAQDTAAQAEADQYLTYLSQFSDLTTGDTTTAEQTPSWWEQILGYATALA